MQQQAVIEVANEVKPEESLTLVKDQQFIEILNERKPGWSVYGKISQVKFLVKNMRKDMRNEKFGWKYVGLPKLLKELNPILDGIGLVVTISCAINNELSQAVNHVWYKIRAVVHDKETGDEIIEWYDFPMDENVGDKKTKQMFLAGGTLTYATRYVYMTLFSIPLSDEDAEYDKEVVNEDDRWFYDKFLPHLLDEFKNDRPFVSTIPKVCEKWANGEVSKDSIIKIYSQKGE